MSEIINFKDLKIWRKGMDIAEKCYFLTKLFPRDELYSMVQQIRSAVSIPANIAEGSIDELETHLILSQRVGLTHILHHSQ